MQLQKTDQLLPGTSGQEKESTAEGHKLFRIGNVLYPDCGGYTIGNLYYI